jgi:hypothetical protein
MAADRQLEIIILCRNSQDRDERKRDREREKEKEKPLASFLLKEAVALQNARYTGSALSIVAVFIACNRSVRIKGNPFNEKEGPFCLKHLTVNKALKPGIAKHVKVMPMGFSSQKVLKVDLFLGFLKMYHSPTKMGTTFTYVVPLAQRIS